MMLLSYVLLCHIVGRVILILYITQGKISYYTEWNACLCLNCKMMFGDKYFTSDWYQCRLRIILALRRKLYL